MDTKSDKNIGIIGAGIAGLTAGALLTKHGFKVDIFEKEPFIGGRALSFDGSSLNYPNYKHMLSRFNMNVPFSEPDIETIFKKKMLAGYKLDLGYHAIGGGVLSNMNSALSELDEHIDILESRVGFIKEEGFDFPFLSKVDMLKISPYIIRLLISGERTMKKLDNVSMTQTIQKYGRGKMKLILEVFSRSITTVNNLNRISTGEMFRSQKNLYKGSKPVGYPKGGLGIINKKFYDYIINNGGEIHLNLPVEKILIENKKAVGIFVNNKKYIFDKIVSSMLLQNIFSIVDEKYFPKDYVSTVNSLTGTGSLCAYYSLSEIDSNLLGKTFHFIERDVGVDGDDVVGMIDFMSALSDSGMAPKSDFLVQSYVICTPREARDKKTLKVLRSILDTNLEKLIPDYHLKLKWAIYPAIWHLDGVAKTIDNKKPSIKTPIENLYVIGDCVKAPGIGFNCSLNSARMLTRMLTE